MRTNKYKESQRLTVLIKRKKYSSPDNFYVTNKLAIYGYTLLQSILLSQLLFLNVTSSSLTFQTLLRMTMLNCRNFFNYRVFFYNAFKLHICKTDTSMCQYALYADLLLIARRLPFHRALSISYVAPLFVCPNHRA